MKHLRRWLAVLVVSGALLPAQAQELRPDEMILEFERLSPEELRQAVMFLQATAGVEVVALSPVHQVILLRIDEQQTSKHTLITKLAEANFWVREKYGTIEQVMTALGHDFLSPNQFQPRQR
ncbi:MAG: hypothetical protein NZL95_04710 [Chitinophagales bacterium]|nr:hypothetical protein [Chitinophagales bacterium]MDW8427834.1 hypothetical protein [Chitinophagales bacterium]